MNQGAVGSTTLDGFLDGQLRVEQPEKGFRAGTDSVLLAAAVPARAGQTCLDLGCGVGTAALCLAKRTGAICTGLELQTDYAALAGINARRNDLDLEVIVGDVRAPPVDLRQRSFDHVFFNPPYFPEGAGNPAQDTGRDLALRGDGDIATWMAAAVRRTKPKGTVTAIARTDRLPELLAALPRHLGSVQVLPLAARAGRPAKRFILRGIKEGRAPFVLCAPVVLHTGAAHGRDGDDASALANAVLRAGEALPFDA